jgi:AsmA protein
MTDDGETMPATKRRGLRIALIVLAAVIVLPVIGLGILALTFDANRLKPRIAAAIEQATGRDVTIGGPVRLALSLRPMLEVDSVTLGNAPGFAPSAMATLDRLDLTLALLPLFHRHIEIERLDLVHPVIALQIDAQGRDNWHFQKPPPPPQAAPQAASAPARPTTLRIQTMSIADGAITFADARTGASIGVDGVRLTATQDDPDGPIHLDATGSDRAMPLAVSGDVGRPSAGFMPISLTLKAAEASLTVAGTAPRFAVSGSIPDLAALSPLAGRPLPALHDVTFRADVAPPPGATYAGGIVVSGLQIGAPTGSVAGDATVTLAAPVAVRANLTTRNLDPAALMAAIPAPETSAPPAAAMPAAPAAPPPAATAPQPAAPARPAWVISDRPLPFARLPGIDADVILTLLDTKAGEAVIASASTHAQLHAGRLVLDPLSIEAPGGHIDATAMADRSGAAAITLRAPALSIQPLLAALDKPDGVIGTMEVRADLRGTGATPHALAAGLDGSVGLALANGEIDNRLLIALLSRIAPEAGLLDLAGKPARSALRCVAVRADIAHGVADLHALLLDTVPLRLTGGGTIDLGQETLALHLQPLARIGATGFSVPVTIRGGFRAPRAAVDAAAGGKGLGGIVMGALGADRLIAGAGQSDGCADQLQLARFGDPGAVPAALPAQEAGKPAAPNLNNLLKRLLR